MRYITIITIIFLVTACRQETKYPYTLTDFPDKLQPYLLQIVNTGFIGDPSYDCVGYLDSFATDQQLLQLTRSEHPILRSTALSIATRRPSIDYYDLLMNHLDDTARVSWYFQCRSYEHIYVSDFMLDEYEWKTIPARKRTVVKVLTEHNYLESAYKVLYETKQDTSYYTIIKTMIQRNYDMKVRAKALYALAAYRKAEDVPLIRDILKREAYRIESTSLSLMKDYPSPLYIPILEHHARNMFIRTCSEGGNFYDADQYLQTIAGYKSPESAAALRKLLTRSPLLPCRQEDSTHFRDALYKAIEENNCSFYKDMIAITHPYLAAKKKREGDPETYEAPPYIPTTAPIRW